MSYENSNMGYESTGSNIHESCPQESPNNSSFSDTIPTTPSRAVRSGQRKVARYSPWDNPNVAKYKVNPITGILEILPQQPVAHQQPEASAPTSAEQYHPSYDLPQSVVPHQNTVLYPDIVQHPQYNDINDDLNIDTLSQQEMDQDDLSDLLPSELDADYLQRLTQNVLAVEERQNSTLMPPPLPNSKLFQSSLSPGRQKMSKGLVQDIKDQKVVKKRKMEHVVSLNSEQLEDVRKQSPRKRIIDTVPTITDNALYETSLSDLYDDELVFWNKSVGSNLNGIQAGSASSPQNTTVSKTKCKRCLNHARSSILRRPRLYPSSNSSFMPPNIQYILRYLVDGLLFRLGHIDWDFSRSPNQLPANPLVTDLCEELRKEQISKIRQNSRSLLLKYPLLTMNYIEYWIRMAARLGQRKIRGRIGCNLNYMINGIRKALDYMISSKKGAIFALFSIVTGCDMKQVREQAIICACQLRVCGPSIVRLCSPEIYRVFIEQTNKPDSTSMLDPFPYYEVDS